MPGIKPNWFRLLTSLAEELHCQSTRVRDLIGDSHWLYDGHHKEYILTELLQRHLPSGVIARRGFVVSPNDEALRSTEQDILIVDTHREAPAFAGGGVVIALPSSVLAAISVKTTLDSGTVDDTVKGLNTVRSTVIDHCHARSLWCGGYFYEVSDEVARNPLLVYGHIASAITAHAVRRPLLSESHPIPRGPDLLCTAKELAYRLDHGYQSGPGTATPSRIEGFRCQGLSTAVFLATLLSHVASVRNQPPLDLEDLSSHFRLEPLAEPHRELTP